jgi:2-deoxy-D-gluconate 3-dehydrogenase
MTGFVSGKVAIVTGGGRGIGRAIAMLMAKEGASVIVVDIGAALDGSGGDHGPAQEVVNEIKQAGGQAIASTLSITEPQNAEAIVKSAIDTFGRVDILVNNAGILRRADPLAFTEKDWDDVINVDLKSVFFLAQAFAKRALARGGGAKIINGASILAQVGGIRVPSYTAAKHGVAGLTKLLANEWAAKGINVNALAPGYVRTDATQALQDDPVRNERLLSRIPAGRWGDPQDMAGAAVFLASRASDYCHGTILVVDGGWLAG